MQEKRARGIRDIQETANILAALSTGNCKPLHEEIRRYNEFSNDVVIFVGEQDYKYLSMANNLTSRGILPEKCIHILKGCGHASHIEAPWEVADTLRSIL